MVPLLLGSTAPSLLSRLPLFGSVSLFVHFTHSFPCPLRHRLSLFLLPTSSAPSSFYGSLRPSGPLFATRSGPDAVPSARPSPRVLDRDPPCEPVPRPPRLPAGVTEGRNLDPGPPASNRPRVPLRARPRGSTLRGPSQPRGRRVRRWVDPLEAPPPPPPTHLSPGPRVRPCGPGGPWLAAPRRAARGPLPRRYARRRRPPPHACRRDRDDDPRDVTRGRATLLMLMIPTVRLGDVPARMRFGGVTEL